MKKWVFIICFMFSLNTLFGQQFKLNKNFVGHWALEGYKTKMIIYERNEKFHAIVINWAYCEELETLETVPISENKLFVSTKNPSNNFTVNNNLEIINKDKLKNTVKGNADAVIYWNRIK